jgi:hypothetical protein
VLVTQRFYGVFTIEQLRAKHERHTPITQIFGGNGND